MLPRPPVAESSPDVTEADAPEPEAAPVVEALPEVTAPTAPPESQALEPAIELPQLPDLPIDAPVVDETTDLVEPAAPVVEDPTGSAPLEGDEAGDLVAPVLGGGT